MIVPMSKLSVVVIDEYREQATKDLLELGIVHLVHRQVAPSVTHETLAGYKEEIRIARAELAAVPKPKKYRPGNISSKVSLEEAMDEIRALVSRTTRLRNIEHELQHIRQELNVFAIWGDFDPAGISELANQGLKLTPVYVPTADPSVFPPELEFITLRLLKDARLIVVVGQGTNLPTGSRILTLPHGSPGESKKLLGELEGDYALGCSVCSDPDLPAMVTYADYLVGLRLEFVDVRASMERDDLLATIEGFVPKRSADNVKFWAKQKGWAILLRDPDLDEEVPTLLETPGPAMMVKPVLGFLGTLPDYRSQDVSIWFVSFLILFFAMLINDGGYGVVILLAAVGFFIKSAVTRTSPGPFPALLTCFGLVSIAWGAVTGTWFSIESLSLIDPFKRFIIPWLYSYYPENHGHVQILCFVIGLIHLNLGHLLRFLRYARETPHIHAIAQLGWIAVLNGAFLLVLNLIIDPKLYPIPPWDLPLVSVGIVIIVLFENQRGDGFIRGVGRAAANLIATMVYVIGSFADIISYIRLFAVGLAGFYIAESFNGIAQPMLQQGGFGNLTAASLILLLSHGLNLALGCLAVIVHGVRLNMLEFTHHVGIEWSGVEYRPFSYTNGGGKHQ